MLGGFPAWICTHQPSRDLSKAKPQSLVCFGSYCGILRLFVAKALLRAEGHGSAVGARAGQSTAPWPSAHPEGRRRQRQSILPCLWGHVAVCGDVFVVTAAGLLQGHVCEMAPRALHGTALPEMCRCLRAAAEKPHSQLWVLLLQVVTLSTTPTRSSFWSALTSTFVATPSALAPKSSEVSFVFWGSQAWADASDTLSAGAKAHRESLCWSVQAPMGGQPRLCRD